MLVDQRYRIDRKLARGGMATVYIAHDERLDRPIALKVMHPHLAESADFVARFRREARAAARIIHPGVVSVFDQGIVHGQGFLVMELVSGPNLRTLLNSQGAFTLSQALRYTQEILDALHAAHRVGVVHRDMKPENVLISEDSHVRVTDFGLARAASEVSMSTTGSMLGTVAYMAPEIATTGHTDARTDIYSVGMMLYEMVVGHVPWDGAPAMKMAYSHVNEDVPSPSEECSWLPTEIDELVATLAARDPAERPRDARDALELVARVRASLPSDLAERRADVQPVQSGQPTAPIEFHAVTTALPGGVLTPSSQTVVKASGSLPRTDRPHKKSRSRLKTVIALLAVLLIVGSGGGWWWWSQYGPGSYLTMPQTDGRAVKAVQSELEALGLSSTLNEEFSDDVKNGLIIRSDPASGSQIHKDGEVSLVVSKGVDMRAVPQLVGLSADQARGALTNAGLAAGTVSEEYSDSVAKGQVISQSEEAAAQVRHDTAVDFVVSKGCEPITVPDLAGMTGEEARAAVEEAGLAAESTSQHSDAVPEGQIISQSAEAGSTLLRGDTLSFVVSEGPELVEVPDLVGKQLDQAEKTLRDAGFKVEVNKILGGIFGTVRSTDPGSGQMIPKGSTVTITVV